MPSKPSLQACRNTVPPSSSVCSLKTIPAGFRPNSLASFALRALRGRGRRSSPVEFQEIERVQDGVAGLCRRLSASKMAITKHDRPGRKSPGCPAKVFAAVGTIWGARKLGGRNIKEYLQPRERALREVVIRGINAGSRPNLHVGKADDIVEETGDSTRCTTGVWDPASKERFSEITSGSSRGQQGLRTTCQDSSNEAKCRSRREPNGSGT